MILKLILQFFLGLGVGVYGYLVPSYINLGVFQLGMKQPNRVILNVLLIISLVEIPYCFICMNSMQWIMEQKSFLLIIRWLIVLLLFALSIITFLQAKKNKRAFKTQLHNKDDVGVKKLIWYAVLNPFQLSAWAIWGTYFIEKTWFNWNPLSILIFSMGASLGVLLILYLYAQAGQKLVTYFSSHERTIQYGIAFILIVLAFFQLIRNVT
jgi:hypothetical protein